MKQNKLRVGWSSHWFSDNYIDKSGVIKNQREVPIIKEILSRGHTIYNLSPARSKSTHRNVIDCSQELRKLPGADKFTKKDGIPVTSAMIKHNILNYRKYGVELPKLDVLIMNGFPLFPQQNQRFYLLLAHYAPKFRTRIFIYDSEIELLRRIFTKDFDDGERKARMSGTDKILPQKWYKELWDHVTFAYPVNDSGIEIFKKYAPEYNYISYFFPWDRGYQKVYSPKTRPKRRLVYIGNDTGRRKIFNRYFNSSEKILVIGGARTGDNNSYPIDFQKKFPNIKFKPKKRHSQIMAFYRNSIATLSLPKPRYEKIGFQVGRWSEAVMNGCILFLPEEFNFADEYVDDFCIVKPENIRKKLDLLENNYEFRCIIWKEQRDIFKKMFSPKAQVDRILNNVQ